MKGCDIGGGQTLSLLGGNGTTKISCFCTCMHDAALMAIARSLTQGSADGLFSSPRIIRTDIRTAMQEDLLESIPFLGTNAYYVQCALHY